MLHWQEKSFRPAQREEINTGQFKADQTALVHPKSPSQKLPLRSGFSLTGCNSAIGIWVGEVVFLLSCIYMHKCPCAVNSTHTLDIIYNAIFFGNEWIVWDCLYINKNTHWRVIVHLNPERPTQVEHFKTWVKRPGKSQWKKLFNFKSVKSFFLSFSLSETDTIYFSLFYT